MHVTVLPQIGEETGTPELHVFFEGSMSDGGAELRLPQTVGQLQHLRRNVHVLLQHLESIEAAEVPA